MAKKFCIPVLLVFWIALSGCSLLISDDISDVDCSDVVSEPTPTINNNFKYYVILVEGSEDYKSYRDEGFNVISKVLNTVLRPGDHIVAIWMEVSKLGTDDALFFSSDIESFSFPVLAQEPIPTLLPLPTPLNSGETPASKRQHENIVEEVNEKNNKVKKEHYCKSVIPIRKDNNEKVENWKNQNEREKHRAIENLSEKINSSNPDYMSVFEALKLASDIFSEVCTNGIYTDCQLIIVSDMVDWRSNLDTPEVNSSIKNMNIDFSQISVSIIWPDCEFFSDEFKSQCESRKETWNKHFSTFNAIENDNLIFINMNNATDRLISFIGE